MSRFGAESARELLLHPYFFDCLHLDGMDLLDEPLRERLRRPATGCRRSTSSPALTRADSDAAADSSTARWPPATKA